MGKIGRNDPCPCGSGMKFKKCCDAPTRQASLTLEQFQKEIAYLGSIGAERKASCEQYIDWKKQKLEEISQEIQNSGYTVSCLEGCSHCCSQHIGAYLQECDAIVYWLYQNPEVMDAFLVNYPGWRAKVGDIKRIGDLFNQFFANCGERDAQEAYLKEAENYGKKNVPCPFLKDNRCMIYPVRPLVCATYVTTSPPENCKSTSEVAPIVLRAAAFEHILQPAYFRGTGYAMGNMPLLVQQLLIGGFGYLEQVLGMKDLESEVCALPRVKSLLPLLRRSK